MPEPLPIPPHIWKRILAWLRAGGTGRITLDAQRGSVRDAWINERIEHDGHDRNESVIHSRSAQP